MEETDLHPIIMRLEKNTVERIDNIIRDKKPVYGSRHHWVVIAIEEKLERGEAQ